jgi:hypothetical protein
MYATGCMQRNHSLIDFRLFLNSYWEVFHLKPTPEELIIPKGQSESVYRRRTENAMAKRKSTKGQTTIYKTYI